MKRRIRILLIEILVTSLLAIGIGGGLLCENALRLPQTWRNDPPPNFGYPVEITAFDGIPLRGSWFPPKEPDGPVVLALHGVGDSRRGMSGIVPILQRNGYGVLAPDSRGHGVSGGTQFTFGLKEVDDVNRWVNWILKSNLQRHIYGLGESMGAGILLQASGPGTRFRAVVAESPFASFRMIANYRVGQQIGFLSPVFVEAAFLYARLKYQLKFSDASPLKQVGKSAVPILLIHGTADQNIPIEHTRVLAAANPARIQVWVVPGGDHVEASSRAPAEFEKRVVAWFRAN
ncbi:alpha/beta hydrolase [uncultured Paludibaculum sp.]|uniref:alpha/beta hydrolase n=1 Tax=uncultured Paludibaculum sp. TaxID=1765020 RepID=UPI002AAB3F7F|nr:alpha/beta hydrolase [uncultured Paludibaculum sp.]